MESKPGETHPDLVLELSSEALAVLTPDKRLFKCVVAELQDSFINLQDLEIVEYLQSAHPDTIAQYGTLHTT